MRRMNKGTVIIILIVFFLPGLITGFLGMSIYDMKQQIHSLEMQVQMLQDDQVMMAYNQRRLTEAVTNFLDMWQVDMFDTSAYSPLDDRNGLNSDSNPEYMASMVKTREVVDIAIAVDPKIIPLGSPVWIEGGGWRRELDTGGAIKKKRVDICMRSFDDAIQYGVREARVVWPRL